MFVDLVKAFNTANHEILMTILDTYAGLPICVSTIKRMYENSVVRLILGKVDTAIDFTTGVKQGDSMVPVLFLFLVIVFSKILEREWDNTKLTKPLFSCRGIRSNTTANSYCARCPRSKNHLP